ncbi:TPA: phage tail tape measure protein [Aeromonas hydrophila]|nr:phage tail tape measure protein [Aeromonas hydrophila]
MTDKKYSITLSAKEQLSAAFGTAGEAANKLRKEVDDTNKQLKQLGDTTKRAADMGRLNSELANTKSSLAGVRAESRQAGADIKRLTAEQATYKKELAAAERQLAKMQGFVGPVTPAQQESIQAATAKVAALKASYGETGKAIKAAEQAQKVANGEAKRLTDTLGSQSRRLGSLAGDLGKAGVNTKALGAEQLRLKRDTEQATAAMERQQRKLATISDAQAKMAANKQRRSELYHQVAGPLGEFIPAAAQLAPAAGIAMSVKKAVDYESAFAGVTKVVNFKSEEDKAAARSSMMELAGQLGVDQVGMTNIVAAAGEAGIGKRADGTTDRKELLRFASDASKMAVAMDMTAEEAGTIMAKQRSAMGMDQAQVMRLADYSNAVSNEMAAKPAEVARVMLRQGATTMKAGFNDRQAAALAASLIAGGEGEETTATAMKNITGRLNKSFAATKAQKDTLAMLGFDPVVLAKDMQRDAGGTLFKVLGQIGKQDVDKQAAVISQLFGEEVVGAVSKLTANTDLLKKAMKLAGDEAAYAGSMEAEYQNKAKTRKAMLERAGANFDRLIINLGDLFLPLLDEIVQPVSDMAAAGAKLMETSAAARETAGVIVKVGAGLLALKAGMIVFKGVKSLFSDMFQAGRIMKAKLGGQADNTARSGNAAARALAAVNRQLDRMGGASGPTGRAGRRGKAGRTGRGSRLGRLREAENRIAGVAESARGGRRFGRFGKGAGLFGLGAGLMMLPKGAEASEMVKDVADVGGGAAEVLAGAGKTVGHVAGKVIRPLGLISSGSELYGAAMTGNTAVMAGAAGDIAGGAAGGWAGAAAGAAIGSVVPVIGTAVGAAVGGALGAWGGGELGSMLGETIGSKLTAWFSDDKTAIPGKSPAEQIVQQTNKTETSNKFDIKFDVRASGDPEQDNALVTKIQQAMTTLIPSLLATATPLDTRMDGSLMGLGRD